MDENPYKPPTEKHAPRRSPRRRPFWLSFWPLLPFVVMLLLIAVLVLLVDSLYWLGLN